MMIKVSEYCLSYLSNIDAKLTEIEARLYSGLFGLTKDINELSGAILELNDLKINLDLHEFDGQF
tara:strand:- start:2007 stop:2201 length:195 start_codon:yes stop_codon:yes gene_type:complete